jgi:ABC-type transport system involved in multi-copper enzyme maturation permease subunit
MNTPAVLTEPSAPTAPTPVPIRRLRFSTLTAVEMRKMTDTRSSRAVLVGILGLAVVVLGWKLTHESIGVSFENYGGAVASIVAFLVPVIGLLAMTSEWTQRTALATFTLAPRRLPVIAAKFVAAVVVSLGVLAAGVLLAVGATAIGGLVHGHAGYGGMFTDIRSYAIVVLLQVTMAAAFGALAAQSTVALVAYFAAPTAWAAVSTQLLKGASPWFNIFAAYDHLSSSQPFEHIAQSLTSIAVWVAVPSVLGVARSLRREVK